jgi:hypothetical protein
MKTKAIVAALLIAAAASADARFAWPYPRKAVSPDESGVWIVINGSAWPRSAESERMGEELSPRKQASVNETAVNSSNRLSDSRSEALVQRLAQVASK